MGQDELGQYDYGFRFYDPVIARWNVIDPMAENHYDTNPYHYVLNNPMLYMDYMGLDTTYNGGTLKEVKITGPAKGTGSGNSYYGYGSGWGDYDPFNTNNGGSGDFGGFSMTFIPPPPPVLSSSAAPNKGLDNRGNMSLSPQGLQFIANNEGFPKRQPYNDPLGYATAGYGHLLHKSKVNSDDVAKYGGMTKTQGVLLLNQDVASRVAVVNKLVNVPLNQNQFDTLVDFTFNVGNGAFSKSTLLRQINTGNFDGVPTQLMRWTNGGNIGLINRRNAEINLFVNGVYR